VVEIGEISTRTGVNIETIRYYERIGLVPKPPRASNGRRVYDAQAEARLGFIRRARDLGFALADIRVLMTLGDSQMACCDAYALASRHAQTVRVKIKELRKLERHLLEIAERCARTPTAACPIIDELTGNAR
jgi:MerR family mercuric resistance operon transcriptional regulator